MNSDCLNCKVWRERFRMITGASQPLIKTFQYFEKKGLGQHDGIGLHITHCSQKIATFHMGELRIFHELLSSILTKEIQEELSKRIDTQQTNGGSHDS